MRLEMLAQRYGTPLYVYNLDAIAERFGAYRRAFGGGALICAAVKANANLAILRLLARLGSGFDVVSGGELERVLEAGAPGERIVFSGVGKTAEEMDRALRAGIQLFNVESEPELDLLAQRAARSRRVARFGLRVNPDIAVSTHPHIATGLREHKFGVSPGLARRLYRRPQRWLEAAGVSCHIGSQIMTTAPFTAAVAAVGRLIVELQAAGLNLHWLDVGGGLGIAYRPGEQAPSLGAYRAAIVRGLREAGLPRTTPLILEPGRSLVGAAGALLTRVLYVKRSGRKKFVIVDAGSNDLLRPALYDAYHHIVPWRAQRGAVAACDVVGPLCESGDFFAHQRALAPVDTGAGLAIFDAGAYGYALSSNYNGRPRPAEVGIAGGRARLLRRRETEADLRACDLK